MSRRRRLAAVAGVAVAAVLVTGCRGERSDARPADAAAATGTGTVFRDRMGLAFTGILVDTATFSTRAGEVAAGARPTGDLLADLDASLHRAQGTRDLVGASTGLSGNPIPKDLYLRSALLYAEALRALRAAVGAQPALRSQLVIQAQRLKVLSDRVYDRGTAAYETDSTDGAAGLALRAEEVPDWGALGLAAGPPLAPSASGSRAPAPQRSDPNRPVQAQPSWADAMVEVLETVRREAGRFPGLATDPAPEVAGRGAAALTEAAKRTRVIPDPVGKREPVTLLRLAILVDAESAWAFAAADTSRGQDLALLAEDLWALAANQIGTPPDLGHPHSLFDRSALEPVPVPGFGDRR